jgi:phosphoribosylaminoimidazole-succinocarboxamide synthase
MPFICHGSTPALASSLQSPASKKLELLSNRNSKSILIADDYRDRHDYQRRLRDNYQSQSHDRDYYRNWYNNHHNQYKGHDSRWYNNQYHGNSDQYYRWYYNQYHR